MRTMRSMAALSDAHGRARAALLLAVAGVLVGLVAMHVLSGGAHAVHDAAAVHVVAHAEPGAPGQTMDCGDAAACGPIGATVAGCTLAAAAFTALLALAPTRWLLSRVVLSFWRASAGAARPAPRPCLVSLSISRT